MVNNNERMISGAEGPMSSHLISLLHVSVDLLICYGGVDERILGRPFVFILMFVH